MDDSVEGEISQFQLFVLPYLLLLAEPSALHGVKLFLAGASSFELNTIQ